MRHAAGELADRLHLLRLTQRLFRLLARFVLRLQFARTVPDRFLKLFGEGAHLHQGALALGHVHCDADHADGTLAIVVEDEAARLHPFQRLVGHADDAEFDLQIARLCRKGAIQHIGNPRLVFAEDAVEPAFVAPVEIGDAIKRQEFGRKPHDPRLHLPLENANAPRLLGEGEKFVAFAVAFAARTHVSYCRQECAWPPPSPSAFQRQHAEADD